ncbi:alpha/beta fold hydrolase [Leucothrix pacifica]|nr:alpha/beta fold hydrolase [Leucothrix pacifica]
MTTMIPLLHYKQFGEESPNKNIILLHGLLGSMDNWRSQASKLAQHDGYRAITPDMRNHGQSPHISGMRYKDMAEDILQLADHLSIERFDLLGHSMGGKVAMYLALNHAERLNKLIIVDIAPKPYELWHIPVFKALLSLPVAEFTSRKQANDELAKSISNDGERAFLLKNLKTTDAGGYEWRCDLQEITRTYLNIASFNVANNVRFNKPCLFVNGGKSPYIDAEEDKELINGLFTQATIQTISEAGHLPHVETPADFYQRIQTFLQN